MTELPVHLLLLITNICNHFLTIVCSNLSFLDMFMKDEIRGLESLYYDIKNDTLESYLTEEDIATINQEADHLHNKNKRKVGSSMAVLNLKNRPIVPRDHFRRCTVVMQRLHDGHDFKEWLEAVARKILMNEFTQIRVGFTVDYQNNADQNNAHLGILAIIDELGVRLWRKVREQQLPIYLISVLESL